MVRVFGNYSVQELADAKIIVGENVSISNDVIFHNPQNIIIGSNVRIDAHCALIAGNDTKIIIGDHVHIGMGCYLFGSTGNITLRDFAGLSSKCTIYTGTDDFTRGHLTNPTVSEEFKRVKKGDVTFEKHAGCGAGCVVMPNVTLGFGSGAGSLSFINKNVPVGDIVFGIPAKRILSRNVERLKSFEEQFLSRQ